MTTAPLESADDNVVDLSLVTTRRSPESSPDATPSGSTPGIAGKARTIALICLLAASFMELMDATVVNVALRTMQVDLGASAVSLQWIVAGYTLAFGMALVPAGPLGDARSRRTVFLWGVGLFTLASAACGASPSATSASGTQPGSISTRRASETSKPAPTMLCSVSRCA